ncbi:MAG: redoxin domain-containing protein [Thiolinea sp.]
MKTRFRTSTRLPSLSGWLLGLTFLLISSEALALKDLQGNEKRFEQLLGQGRWTVFEVWSSQCPACPDAVFYMNELKERGYAKAELIGISVDGDYGRTVHA